MRMLTTQRNPGLFKYEQRQRNERRQKLMQTEERSTVGHKQQIISMNRYEDNDPLGPPWLEVIDPELHTVAEADRRQSKYEMINKAL